MSTQVCYRLSLPKYLVLLRDSMFCTLLQIFLISYFTLHCWTSTTNLTQGKGSWTQFAINNMDRPNNKQNLKSHT